MGVNINHCIHMFFTSNFRFNFKLNAATTEEYVS